ncbi:unnamed protein product, partial [Sphenostylis stenocarpa]
MVPNLPDHKKHAKASTFRLLKPEKKYIGTEKICACFAGLFELCAMHKADQNLAPFWTLSVLGLPICDCD